MSTSVAQDEQPHAAPATDASAQDQEMASVDPATTSGEGADSGAEADRPISVEDETAADRHGRGVSAASAPRSRRTTARGFEAAAESFAYADQERRGEDRLLDERIRERYIQEIGDPFDERSAR